METYALAQAIAPIHNILRHAGASSMDSVGICPERLTCYYEVEREHELEFLELLRRLYAVDQLFEDRSPLCVFVLREVEFTEQDDVVYGQWQVQFQVNDHGRPDDEVAAVVARQIDAILYDLEGFRYDRGDQPFA